MTRGTSPAGSFAGVDAGAPHTPREVMALQRLAGNAGTARLLAQPVQRAAREADAGAQVRTTGGRAGAGVPAAARVVQRMPWPDPAAAQQNLLQQGWQLTEDGGYTRGPVSEVEESAGGQRPEGAQQEQAADGDANITLRLLVRKNASFRDEDYLQQVGHSWVAFYKDDKFMSSAGFYPTGGQINESSPHRSVPGEVRLNYDDTADATTELSVPLTDKQFSKAKKYIKKNLNHEYNLLRYNCTDFVIEVHKAATGHMPPGRNLLLPNNPNDLHSGIKKQKNKDK